jgi:hypothetical protein
MSKNKKFYSEMKQLLDDKDINKLMKSIYNNINYIKNNPNHIGFKNAIIEKCKKFMYNDIDDYIKNNNVTNKEIENLEEIRECCFDILYQLDEIK